MLGILTRIKVRFSESTSQSIPGTHWHFHFIQIEGIFS
jgi:hypothetical protein